MLLTIFAIITVLVAFNGLYVAAEFSAVSVRKPRLAQLADDGDRTAVSILAIVEDTNALDVYIAACQIGITVSSLLLGFYGRDQLLDYMEPWLTSLPAASQSIAQLVVTIAILLLLTVLQTTVGELVPKNVGLAYPEQVVLLTAAPMRWSTWIFRPLIAFFNGSGRLILRLFGVQPVAEHSHVHSPQEIMLLVEESTAGGLLDSEERRLLVNTLHLRDLTARKVMVPRNRMVTGSVDASCDDLLRKLALSPYSRMPLYAGTIDNIVGVVHLKDLLIAHQRKRNAENGEPIDVRTIMNQIHHVPESAQVAEVLTQMQSRLVNFVVVVDEFGGTAGMLTVEDIVEELIGEFEDEFDTANPPVEVLDNQWIRVRGDVLVEDINNTLGIGFAESDATTIGGLVLNELGNLPKVGVTAEIAGVILEVDSVIGNAVSSVKFKATQEQLELLLRLGEEL